MATKGASDRGQRKAEIYSLPKKSVDQTRRNKPSKYGVHPYIVGTHAAKNLILTVRLPIVEGTRQRMHAYKLVRADRSAARRVGTEGVSTCRYRWSPYY